MFALGIKRKTSKVIQQGAYALFIGNFIDKQMIQESELNEEAQTGLFFFTVANCLYDLYLQMKLSECGEESWSTINFFMENAVKGIERFEREQRIPKGAYAITCTITLGKIGGYAAERGVYPDLMSAREVEQLDNETDVLEAQKFIVAARNKFHSATEHMFKQ